MQTYIANPVRVSATRIVDVGMTAEESPSGRMVTPLALEDGTNFVADSGMTARYFPQAGDYLVIQEDGYQYLNPREVFERKYRLLVLTDADALADLKGEPRPDNPTS
ncbi:hypothetical protein Bcep22_gp53 [Burkholderia phage Bcep22]|uniref:Uncharacterized protein n=1 Tax=Burkholderia phage Bcep22 TaxID=2883944 RepID=Q6V7P0_9CAUD|nr:hypothetical protein Bcep22_gp53 [Burkholderia phage Bcep22]AAQ54986.1 hypothetical protein Bcep22_gp53 [Burkholderia phage Bcep22]